MRSNAVFPAHVRLPKSGRYSCPGANPAELPLTAIGKILKPALVKQEISRVYTRELAAVPGLTVQRVTVRDDKKLGLMAEILASGAVDEAAMAPALLGLAVPYEVKKP